MTEKPAEHPAALYDDAARYYSIAEATVKSRVDAIVGNKYRNSYAKTAQLLLATAEVYWSNSETIRGQKLINEFCEKYSRHRAFKSEQKRMAQKSRLFSLK